MIKNRKLNSIILTTSLIGTIVLTGCSSKKEDNKEYKEVTTQVTTQEATEEVPINNVVSNNYDEIAEVSYNEYKEFYSNIGLDKSDVLKVVKFINDDRDDMSEEEIIETSTNIRKMLYSDQLQSKVRAANAGVVFEEPLAKAPSLVSFVSNEGIKEELNKFESLRDKITNEVETNGVVSDSTKQELIDFAIDTHLDSYSSNYEIYKEENSLGQCYVQNEWREQVFNLAAVVTNKSEITNDRLKGNSIQIAPKTVEESDLLNLYMMYDENVPDDKKQEVLNVLNAMVWYQFSRANTNIINKLTSDYEITTECTFESIKSEQIKNYKLKKELLLASYNFDNNVYEYKHNL